MYLVHFFIGDHRTLLKKHQGHGKGEIVEGSIVYIIQKTKQKKKKSIVYTILLLFIN